MRKAIFIIGLMAALLACQRPEYTIFLAGDSTMAEKRAEKRPETGWGMELSTLLNDNVHVANHAKNGRSTRTFISEGRWKAIVDTLQSGDYVLIQFGHNDQSKHKTERYTSPEDYYNNLCRFVDEVRKKKATPVLLTPIVRRRFDEQGRFYDVHGEYPDLVRKAATDKKVTLLDMHKASEEKLTELGEEKSKALFLIADSGVWENYPQGIDDNTHFSIYGAKVMAELAVKEINKSNLDVKRDVK